VCTVYRQGRRSCGRSIGLRSRSLILSQGCGSWQSAERESEGERQRDRDGEEGESRGLDEDDGTLHDVAPGLTHSTLSCLNFARATCHPDNLRHMRRRGILGAHDTSGSHERKERRARDAKDHTRHKRPPTKHTAPTRLRTQTEFAAFARAAQRSPSTGTPNQLGRAPSATPRQLYHSSREIHRAPSDGRD